MQGGMLASKLLETSLCEVVEDALIQLAYFVSSCSCQLSQSLWRKGFMQSCPMGIFGMLARHRSHVAAAAVRCQHALLKTTIATRRPQFEYFEWTSVKAWRSSSFEVANGILFSKLSVPAGAGSRRGIYSGPNRGTEQLGSVAKKVAKFDQGR